MCSLEEQHASANLPQISKLSLPFRRQSAQVSKFLLQTRDRSNLKLRMYVLSGIESVLVGRSGFFLVA